jgi:drug/metabolite transporter (DMT)-like permease
MSTTATGAALSLITAMLWAISPVIMASAARRIGAQNVNLLRIAIATAFFLLLLPVYALLVKAPIPAPSAAAVGYLVLSSLTGMVVGDFFYYETLVLMGPRRAAQMNTLAPVASVLFAWLWMNERLSWTALGGIALVLGSISFATWIDRKPKENSREPGHVSAKGVAFGLGAAACTGLGAVFTRWAYHEDASLDPILAATLRVGSAAVMLWMIPLYLGRVGQTVAYLADPGARLRLVAGTATGAFGGLLFYVMAFKYAPAGVVSTLAAMSPLLIIPIVSLKYRTWIAPPIVIATTTAILGVALIMWKPDVTSASPTTMPAATAPAATAPPSTLQEGRPLPPPASRPSTVRH